MYIYSGPLGTISTLTSFFNDTTITTFNTMDVDMLSRRRGVSVD